MQVLNSKDIPVFDDDDFLYVQLQRLFNEIKLTQGGTSLDATLRRHQLLRNYAIAKQIDRIKRIETKYFNEDGSVNRLAVQAYHNRVNNA